MNRPAPLDIAFNVAVRTIASRLFPCGFDVTSDASEAPDTLDKLTAHIERTGRLLVWNGASDSTIFADPETNWAFRAWHDWTHWRYQLPFVLAGEREVAERQCADLALVYPGRPELIGWQRLIRIEVVGQASYFESKGRFPDDQYAFALDMLALRAA